MRDAQAARPTNLLCQGVVDGFGVGAKTLTFAKGGNCLASSLRLYGPAEIPSQVPPENGGPPALGLGSVEWCWKAKGRKQGHSFRVLKTQRGPLMVGSPKRQCQ